MNFDIDYLSMTGVNYRRVDFTKSFCEMTLKELSAQIPVALAFNKFDSHREAKEHIYSVTFFTVLIATKLNWTSKRVLKVLAQSALLHEFWLLAEDKELELSNFRDTNDSDQYSKHVSATIEEIKKYIQVDEAVIQVLFQHHELNDGSGEPSKLTKAHIYPLAKILCLAEGFVSYTEKMGCEPYLALKDFFNLPRTLDKYDHDSLRSLINCFIKEDDTIVKKEILKYG